MKTFAKITIPIAIVVLIIGVTINHLMFSNFIRLDALYQYDWLIVTVGSGYNFSLGCVVITPIILLVTIFFLRQKDYSEFTRDELEFMQQMIEEAKREIDQREKLHGTYT